MPKVATVRTAITTPRTHLRLSTRLGPAAWAGLSSAEVPETPALRLLAASNERGLQSMRRAITTPGINAGTAFWRAAMANHTATSESAAHTRRACNEDRAARTRSA